MLKEEFNKLNEIYLEEELKRKLDSIDFLDTADKKIFENYLKDPSAILMEMSNVVGNKVKIENGGLPFSFYLSNKKNVHNQHGIRVKILWNSNKSPENADGYMELHGNYDYVIGSKKYKPTEKEKEFARSIFKKYKVLFAMVWECKLNHDDLADYFKGNMSWNELLASAYNLTEKQYYWVNHCKTLKELENCVREKKIFNMND